MSLGSDSHVEMVNGHVEHIDHVENSPCSPCSPWLNNPSSPCSPRSPWLEIEPLLKSVRDIAYNVHVYLGSGYLEKVYENCLKHRLEKAGYTVETQKELKVFDDDGFLIGDYFADMVVENKLIVELKAVKAIAPEHLAQTMNYLKTTGFPLGLVINFGSYKFETRKVYPPTGDNVNSHVEHIDHVESRGLGQRPSDNPSPCSTRSPRLNNSPSHDSHVEHIEHVENALAGGVPPDPHAPARSAPKNSPCSPCSPRLNNSPSHDSHVEHIDHVENSPCSPRSPRPNDDGHVEHIEHVENSNALRAGVWGGTPASSHSPCSTRSPRLNNSPSHDSHVEHIEHVENSNALRAGVWGGTPASSHSPCSTRSPWLNNLSSPCSTRSPWLINP